ncbi:aldehyde dehydrogenase family protein [Sphaerisporangium sp. NPDC051011]|uniref:aldehyde dehydrogenase family protein n=1 Tax=Sphaerisporangium sp. NPDC051011 TaxID=3155792 RepID=UPI0033EBE31B
MGTKANGAVEAGAGENAAQELFIGGRTRPASGDRRFPVHDPATGEVLAHVADATGDDVAAAVSAAHAARESWSHTPAWQRYEVLRDGADALRRDVSAMAELISAETGKPVREALGEAHNTVRFFEWFSHETLRLPGEAWPEITPTRDAIVVAEPVGVVAAITPWNFPAFMVACKVGAALAAGCTVVLKPAEQTPLTALFIARALHAAGLPDGVLNVVPTSDPASAGQVFLHDARVDCISFTGSRAIGELLMREAAASIKRVLLELGGNSPVVVLDDADIAATASRLVQARYLNAGQACVAANRVYVVESVAEALLAELGMAVRALNVGDPRRDDTNLGPLIDLAAVERIETQIDRAVAQGAELTTGGGRLKENAVSAFVRPAVLTAQGGQEPAVFSEEIFGPVLAVVTCRDEAEAISLANDTEYGLAAYVFTGDADRGLRIARALRAGSVAVNGALTSEPQLPFGGMKASGLGRERGRAGVEEFLELKTIQLAK